MKGPAVAGPRLRRVLNEAALYTLKAHGFVGEIQELPEGDEIEVRCAPRFPVEGARFFLRVEASLPVKVRAGEAPRVPVSTKLMLSWRIVPEPVAVVGIDVRTGAGRVGEVHSFLAWLDRTTPGWRRSSSVLVPLPHALDGATLPRLARMAADSHVLFRGLVGHMKTGGRYAAPKDLPGAVARIRELEFDGNMACIDLLREAGLLEERRDRELAPTEACTSAFARAAVQHAVNARGHADPATAAEAGLSAVARVLLARLPNAAESTVRRCAILLGRFLPVEDADAILSLAGDPDAVSRALAEEE